MFLAWGFTEISVEPRTVSITGSWEQLLIVMVSAALIVAQVW